MTTEYEKSIEAKLIDKNLNAPRLNPEKIDSLIVDEAYYVFPNTTLTICCLTLKNGYQVVGKSACASSENFNEEIGRDIAKTNARAQIWDLEGYWLKSKLADM